MLPRLLSLKFDYCDEHFSINQRADEFPSKQTRAWIPTRNADFFPELSLELLDQRISLPVPLHRCRCSEVNQRRFTFSGSAGRRSSNKAGSSAHPWNCTSVPVPKGGTGGGPDLPQMRIVGNRSCRKQPRETPVAGLGGGNSPETSHFTHGWCP